METNKECEDSKSVCGIDSSRCECYWGEMIDGEFVPDCMLPWGCTLANDNKPIWDKRYLEKKK